MEKYLSVSEAAKAVGTTSETLRHYDRIGLVKPSHRDSWTAYRYYTEKDIVRLNTVRALQLMDLPLREIKRVLEYDDLQKIVDFLAQAEKHADKKIDALRYAKAKIRLAKDSYESKLKEYKNPDGLCVRDIPQRVILLSDTLEYPTVDNLWNYLGHFYDKLPASLKDRFSFEDLAGIYTQNGVSRLFAVCTRYVKADGLKTLPKGKYLCSGCTEENSRQVLSEVIRTARTKYLSEPEFTVQLIVISGILNWNYEVQVYIGD